MKHQPFAALCLLAALLQFAPAALAAPTPLYVNQGTLFEPHLPIDAVSFLNDSGGIFEGEAAFNIGAIIDENINLYSTSDTVNYTNRGFMIFVPGIDFRTFPANIGTPQWAANVVNQGNGLSGGVISSTAGPWSALALYGPTAVRVSSSNIVNSGIIDCGQYIEQYFGSAVGRVAAAGLLQFNGNSVNMLGGTCSMPNPVDIPTDFTFGLLDNYWGVAPPTNSFLPSSLLSGITPANEATVTTRNFINVIGGGQIVLANPVNFYNPLFINPSNVIHQIAFIGNIDPLVNIQTAFSGGGIAVQWQWPNTNPITGVVATNTLVLQDSFGEFTNLYVVQNGVEIAQAAYPRPTFRPVNYFFSVNPAFFVGVPGTQGGGAGPLLSAPFATNAYAAYEAIFSPATQLTSDLVQGNVTNLGGRIEINASDLNLTNARLSALSYALVKATNHFQGADGAQIYSPNFDYILRTTNGSLTFSNLVPPYINFPQGEIQLWSAKWTNIDSTGFTNQFHILFVNSAFTTTSTPIVQTLDLSSTNVVSNSGGDLFVSDVVNVTSNMTFRARSLTVTTNGPAAHSPFGELNLVNMNFFFPDNTPGLLFLTNYGLISSGNTIFFAGSPFDQNSSGNPPYAAFVNHGTVFDGGTSISAKYFEDGGLLSASSSITGVQPFGSISLHDAVNAIITNAVINALSGLIDLTSDNLLISNSTFQADSAIILRATNILSDGIPNIATLPQAIQLGVTLSNANSWACSGLQLPVKPVAGDLLGTTITCTAPTNQTVGITWAAQDRGVGSYIDGNNNVGFLNDAAVGQIIFDAKDSGSKFHFAGPDFNQKYAIYIDEMEFRDFATNTDSHGNYTAFQIDTNFTVYFGEAINNGFSIAAKLAGFFATNPPNGGRFVWVSNYNYGYFSSILKLYPGSVTNRVNSALATTADLNNPFPPTPVWSPTASNVPSFPDQPYFFVDPLSLGTLVTNQPISGSLAGFAGDSPVNSVLSFAKVDGPDWLNVAANGTLSGAPSNTDVGTNVFTLRVTSSSLLSATTTGMVVVTTNSPAGDPPLDPPAPNSIAFPAVSGNTSNTAAGSYYGLVSDTSNGVSVDSSGFATITVTPRGNFTAKVSIAGRSYSASGSLASGFASKTLSSATAASLRLTLQQSGPDQIHGSVSNSISHWSAELLADRWSKNPDDVGGYTIILPPDTNSPTGPEGYGNGFVNVAASGRIHWAGTLADGSKVTQSSAVSKDGYWPLYSSLYSTKGLILGWVLFTNDPARDLSADLGWIKPRGTALKAFSGNFTNSVPALGSSYKTVRGSALGLTQGSLVLTGGPLGTNSITNSFTVDAHNRIKPASRNLRLSVKPGTGLLSGSVLVPGGSRLSFQAALLQHSTNAFGFFLNSGLSGSVNLSPAQ
jgi:hypothetical protein